MTTADNALGTPGPTEIKLLYALTGAVVLAGVYFRFKGLGFSPFAIDEYYIATSVNNILEHGWPRFEVGGYYTRGILLQYLVAPLFASGISQEFAFRLVTVLFSIAALPAVFLLARQMAGITAGCVALAFYSLSAWEVEFARFARMYAPFGTVFLWYMYFLYRRIALEDRAAIRWMQLLTLVAVFLSEFAVFLALLNFLPLCMRRLQRPIAESVLPAALAGFAYYWESIPFRWLGAPANLPPAMPIDTDGGPSLPIHLPPVLMPEMAGNLPWLLGFMVPFLVFAVATGAWLRWSLRVDGTLRDRLQVILPLGILVLALANLFGLVFYGIVILMLLLLSPLDRHQMLSLVRRPLGILTGASVVVSLVFWCAYLAGTDWWRALLSISAGSHFRDSMLLLFNYPNIFRDVIVPWRSAMPVQSVVMVGLVAAGVWLTSHKRGTNQRGFLLVTAIVLGLFVLVPVFEKPYHSTRYTFFLYPVLLVLCAASIVYCSERLFHRARIAVAGSVVATFAMMLLFEDFQVRHLIEIDSERVVYRIDYPRGKVDQYYPRWDFRAPAEFVNANRAPEDIIISAEYSVPHYLEQMDYLYMDQDGGRFEIIAAQQGTRDIWEGAALLRNEAQLFKTIADAPADVWLIAKSDNYDHQTSGERVASQRMDAYRVFRSVDRHLDVYRIPSDRKDARSGL